MFGHISRETDIRFVQGFATVFEQSVQSLLHASTTPLLVPEHDEDEPSVPSGFAVDSLPLRRAPGVGEMDLHSGPMRRVHVRRSERRAVSAARVANLADEHGHGLLMQMLQVRVLILPPGISFCFVTFTLALQSRTPLICLRSHQP